MDTGFVTREKDRLLGELFDFLSIPSVSTLPANAADCRRAAEWLVEEFKRLGVRWSRCWKGKGHPMVWAESPRVPGKPDAAGLRALRCPAARSARRVDHPAVRADRPGRQPLRPGCGRRQGPGLLPAQGLRGGARRRRPAAAERELHHRRRGGVRGRCHRRPAQPGARAHPGRRRARGRHGLLRAGDAGGLHGAPRHVLRRDSPPDPRARPPLGHLRRGRAQRDWRPCADS